ncbi:MAG: hypothetical protein ACK5L6_13355 [Anaerorhabdus sp.]|uniref:hypothetical protein n=1 Tax=Anaerorhabdus sp. TaxID=1872524 RepID=UPI003A8A5EE9
MNKRKLRKPFAIALRCVGTVVVAYIILFLMALYLGAAHEQALNKYQYLQIEQEEIINESEW